jgi:hypothetical protein
MTHDQFKAVWYALVGIGAMQLYALRPDEGWIRWTLIAVNVLDWSAAIWHFSRAIKGPKQ